MKFMALDLAASTGFAIGESGSMPSRSGSVRLRRKGDDFNIAVRNLGCFIRDVMVMDKLEAIVVENYLDPSILGGFGRAAHDEEQRMRRSPDAIIAQIKMHGAAITMCGIYGIEFHTFATQTIRRHFIGQAHANLKSRGPTTARQKDEMRAKTKAAVMQRAKLLGYMPKESVDDNFADACALYDFASASLFRRPVTFAMFGAAQ